MHIELDARAAARHRDDPGGDPVQRVAGAHVRGGDARRTSTRSSPSAAKWDILATVIGEVTDGDRLVITWHGETVVDVPPRTVAHDGPVYQRPVAALRRRQDALVADAPDRLPRPAAPSELRAEILRMAASRRTCAAGPGSPTSTTATCAATPCSAQPADAGMVRVDEADRARDRGRHRLQRPVRRARPVRRRPARAGRGLPQRGHLRRGAAGRDQLPELRLAGGPARDVAVRSRPSAGWPTAARSWASRSPAATSASTTRPARRRSCPTPVVGVLGVIDDVARRVRSGFARDGDAVLLLGDDARRARRQRVGARRARAPRRPAARGRPRRRAAAGRAARRGRGGPAADRRRTTCPTAAWPRRWSRRASSAAAAPR